ncbi:MAG: PA14 domain-containing protein, partial [Caldisericia bacterium]|nr:PA14 domain-containing protein [Caldisericia bacterium]
LEILISQVLFVSLPNQKNWVYLSWQDTRNILFQEQIPEGSTLRFINEDPEKEGILTSNLNSLLAKYYNNANCLGKPVYEDKTRTINYDWGIKKPNAFVNQDHFSVYWIGLYEFVEGYYHFITQSDDGLVIKIDGEKIVEQWFAQARREKVKRLHIEEGKHLIEIYYYDHTGPAGVEVKWERE